MRTNAVKEKLGRGETVVGCDISFYAPFAVELMGVCGFDYVMINCEYSTIDEAQVEHLCQVAELRGVTPFVRVPAESGLDHCRRMLDRGAMGIMLPHVRTPEYARAFVKACKYVPVGTRSQCSRLRTNDFGAQPGRDYSAQANRETMCIALCENEENVDNVGAIAAVEGLDVVYLGPGDLAADLGWPAASVVQGHVDRMRRAILEAGKVAGFGARHSGVADMKAKGYRFVGTITQDLLQESYREFVRLVREA